MLIIWGNILAPEFQIELIRIDQCVSYWPTVWMKDADQVQKIAIEWWISFSKSSYGSFWLLNHPEFSKVIYKN